MVFEFFIASLISALVGMFVSMSSSGGLPSNRGGLQGSSWLIKEGTEVFGPS